MRLQTKISTACKAEAYVVHNQCNVIIHACIHTYMYGKQILLYSCSRFLHLWIHYTLPLAWFSPWNSVLAHARSPAQFPSEAHESSTETTHQSSGPSATGSEGNAWTLHIHAHLKHGVLNKIKSLSSIHVDSRGCQSVKREVCLKPKTAMLLYTLVLVYNPGNWTVFTECV